MPSRSGRCPDGSHDLVRRPGADFTKTVSADIYGKKT
jgi:hypothetical protein